MRIPPMAARLQYGPFDGTSGHVTNPVPFALDVRPCWRCGCDRPTHYLVVDFDSPRRRGYARYEFVGQDLDGVIYRHADTLDPATERTIMDSLRS